MPPAFIRRIDEAWETEELTVTDAVVVYTAPAATLMVPVRETLPAIAGRAATTPTRPARVTTAAAHASSPWHLPFRPFVRFMSSSPMSRGPGPRT